MIQTSIFNALNYKMNLTQSVNAIFKSKYGKEPLLVIAPGRINLIGEHTDYNDGFVMPAAVDKQIVFAMLPNQSDRFNFYSVDYDSTVSFTTTELSPGQDWHHYLMGVIDGIINKGHVVGGVDCVLGGDIPAGAGMSSSAALCSGFGFGLNELFDLKLSRFDLAKIGQAAEHNFAGVKCGIMDQFASLFGKEESAILLDCRSLDYEYLPFHFPEVEILLVDTKVKHSLGSSEYNNRRAACEEGVEMIRKVNPSVQSLRDATLGDLNSIAATLSPGTVNKCQFIIEEIKRTHMAASLLKKGELLSFGKLMNETHWGLSRQYEVSCTESDYLVHLAEDYPNEILGARQMGGGFGGCIINLIRKEAVESYSLKVRDKYFATFRKEPDFYSINLCKGVHTMPQN
jgi:galactokinase